MAEHRQSARKLEQDATGNIGVDRKETTMTMTCLFVCVLSPDLWTFDLLVLVRCLNIRCQRMNEIVSGH